MQRLGGWRPAAAAGRLPIRRHMKAMGSSSSSFSSSLTPASSLLGCMRSQMRWTSSSTSSDARLEGDGPDAAAKAAPLAPTSSSSSSSTSSSSSSPKSWAAEGKRFGQVNVMFHVGAKGLHSILAGHLHKVSSLQPESGKIDSTSFGSHVRAEEQEQEEQRSPIDARLNSTRVFASMVDLPIRVGTSSSMEMWDARETKMLLVATKRRGRRTSTLTASTAYRMDSVKRKRDRKMNKHKHRKKLKETRFLRRKLKQA